MLTKQQEELLVSSERNKWAKKLRELRNVFKEGKAAIDDYFRRHPFGTHGSFIKKKRVDLLYIYGPTEFEKLKALSEKQELVRTKWETSTFLYVDEEEHSDSDDFKTEPVAILCYLRYSFLSLSDCKKLIERLIKHTVEDAIFKFKIQPNGKDVRRYRKIIEEHQLLMLKKVLNRQVSE